MKKHAKLSISVPLDLVIKIDLERNELQPRSGWITDAIEKKLLETKEGESNDSLDTKEMKFKF